MKVHDHSELTRNGRQGNDVGVPCRTTKRKATVLAAALAFTINAGTAGAGPYQGVQCNPVNASMSQIEYGRDGVHNNSTQTPAKVHCGGGKPSSFPVTHILATVFDRSNTDNVCCTFWAQDFEGRVVGSAFACTSGFSSVPVRIQGVPHVGFIDVHVNLECTLPAQTSNGVSQLITYTVIP